MKIHMVKKGESLYLIAQKYNVPLEALIGANPEIANPDVIDVGMKVKIPAPAHPAYEMMHQHTVQQGDTLWKLSKAWGIPLSDMIKANPQLKNPNVLLTGEVVNIPKLPTAASGGASHTMPGAIPGKKNTAVMPEAVIPEMPVPEVKEVEMIAPEPVVPETPPMPLPMPMPMPLPQIETKHPYPMTIKQEIHEHNLFAQYPVPAVEASAQVPAEPCPPEAAHYAQYGMGDYGNHAYYAHYHPSDWSGEAVKQVAYGDVSPAVAPGPVQPSAAHGYMPMPTNVAPAAGAAHNPYATGYWPSPTAWPVSPIAGAANADDCGCGCGGTSYAQPVAAAQAQWPYPGMTQATMPAASAGYPSASHYGHSEMVSPAFTQPAEVAPVSAMPEFPSGMHGYPMFHPAALPGLYDPCMPYGSYGMPYGDSRYGYGVTQYPYMPAVPTVPAVSSASQASGHESLGGDADSLALHGADEELAAAPATRGRKQGGSGKSKRAASVRKAKPKRRESLPWIKW